MGNLVEYLAVPSIGVWPVPYKFIISISNRDSTCLLPTVLSSWPLNRDDRIHNDIVLSLDVISYAAVLIMSVLLSKFVVSNNYYAHIVFISL